MKLLRRGLLRKYIDKAFWLFLLTFPLFAVFNWLGTALQVRLPFAAPVVYFLVAANFALFAYLFHKFSEKKPREAVGIVAVLFAVFVAGYYARFSWPPISLVAVPAFFYFALGTLVLLYGMLRKMQKDIAAKQARELKNRARPLEWEKETAEENFGEAYPEGIELTATPQEKELSKENARRNEKVRTEDMIARALRGNNIRFVMSNNRKAPDFELWQGERRIAVDVEERQKKRFLVREKIERRRGKYQGVVLVTELWLERHYKRAVKGTKAKVMSLGEFTRSLDEYDKAG